MDEDVLRHHGIKGQKWGIRRFQNPDGTYTDEGRKRRNSERASGGNSKEKRCLSSNQKRAIAAGATAVAAAVALYGVHRLGRSGKLDDLVKRGKEVFEKAKESKSSGKDPKKMSDDELREAVKRMSLEQQYSKLKRSSDVQKGKSAVNKVMKTASTIATVTSTSLAIYNNVDRIKKIFEEQSRKRKEKKQDNGKTE